MTLNQIFWKTQPIVCNLCGENDTLPLWSKDEFLYARCRRCGLIYINPQLLPSEIERIYEIAFANKSASKPRPADFALYQPILRWAAQYQRAMRFLEIGCFKAYLLVAARERGWSAYGTEISAQAVDFARREYQLDVFLGSLSEAHYPSSQFDVAVMQDVFEHLSDPKSYLQEMARILRPGGGLYIETPNFNSITRHVLGKDWSVFFPWHQFYFTPETLRLMLGSTGFKVRKVECVGLSPLSRYNALRAFEERHEIVSASRRRLKSFVELRAPSLRKPLIILLFLGNLPFRFLSAMGVHLGTKMIVYAEKAT